MRADVRLHDKPPPAPVPKAAWRMRICGTRAVTHVCRCGTGAKENGSD